MAKISRKNHKFVTLSFIILPFNRPLLLKRCLKSISKLTFTSYEVILVNNGDKILNNLTSLCKNISIFEGNKTGIAQARNIGISKSSGKYLIFLDDDAFFSNPNQIRDALNFFKSKKDVAVIAPKVVYPTGKIQESIRRYPNLIGLLTRAVGRIGYTNYYYDKYLYNDCDRNNIFNVEWAIGACLITKRESVEKVHGFTKHYSYGYDDADFCRKLTRKGYKIVYFPKIKVVHDYQRFSAKGIFTKYKLMHTLGIIRFLLT